MNNEHRFHIEQSWSFNCRRCNSIFPTQEASEVHGKLCYKSVPNLIIKSAPNAVEIPKSLQIVNQPNLRTKSNYTPMLMEKPVLTYQRCGLCSKSISGKTSKKSLGGILELSKFGV